MGGNIKPATITRFWHRRICEVAFLVASTIVTLYFWSYFATRYNIPPNIGKPLIVDTISVIIAAATMFICFVSYLWVPKKLILPTSLIIYLLIAAMAATLIIGTGKTSSPFISLWILSVIFSGIFGLWGTLPILLSVGIFAAIQYINNDLTIIIEATIIFSSLLPLFASLIIWHSKSKRDEIDDDNRAYKNLENELSEVASKSEVVINAIGDGVIAIDSQGLIQLINPAAQSLIGWGKQDALALNYKSVLKLTNQKDEILDTDNNPIQQSLNTNQEIRTNNLSIVTNNNKKIMISLVVSPVGDVGAGVIAVFHDITKEKSEEREQAEFISTASHEMRTPVASIEGYLGLALNPQTAQIDDRARDFILKAHESAEHLGHLFQDLLDVAKSEDGRMSNKPKLINVVIFLHNIIQGLSQKAIDKGIQLTYKPMPENATERFIAPSYYVNLDNDHIREIINNLIENAIKYTPKGSILVDVNGDDEHIVISVKDNGIGIPAEDMSHLFQKFYRVENKDTSNIGGTGLGLYLCRRLVEIMGGRIWAESEYKKGSTFFLELPRVSSQEASSLAEQQATNEQNDTNRKIIESEARLLQSQEKPKTSQSNPESIRNETQHSESKPAHPVPRGQALTQEQITEYVAKQRILAQQQANPQLNRSQSISIPVRDSQK